jgi:hypothetical protein
VDQLSTRRRTGVAAQFIYSPRTRRIFELRGGGAPTSFPAERVGMPTALLFPPAAFVRTLSDHADPRRSQPARLSEVRAALRLPFSIKEAFSFLARRDKRSGNLRTLFVAGRIVIASAWLLMGKKP